MYLTVKHADGTVTHIPVSNSHEIRVVGPDQKVQDAFAIGGVDSIELDKSGNPSATDPSPAQNQGAAEGGTETDEQRADREQVEAAAQKAREDAEAAAQADADAAEQAQRDKETADAAEADKAAHDAAAVQAATAIAAVTGGSDTVEAAPDETHGDVIAAAQADVETALAQWPDSAELQDAKAQLEKLAADAAPPAAA